MSEHIEVKPGKDISAKEIARPYGQALSGLFLALFLAMGLIMMAKSIASKQRLRDKVSGSIFAYLFATSLCVFAIVGPMHGVFRYPQWFELPIGYTGEVIQNSKGEMFTFSYTFSTAQIYSKSKEFIVGHYIDIEGGHSIPSSYYYISLNGRDNFVIYAKETGVVYEFNGSGIEVDRCCKHSDGCLDQNENRLRKCSFPVPGEYSIRKSSGYFSANILLVPFCYPILAILFLVFSLYFAERERRKKNTSDKISEDT